MLAQFALIVFAMCAVLGLIIDIGYVRLTQAQMQNAADTAALEGLRTRDRAAANVLVKRLFDDDLDPANEDNPDDQFGAGPIIDLTEGATSLHALQTMSVPASHVYKPDLQPNLQNAVYGDMVSGSFVYSADPAASEDATYVRNDFTSGVGNSAFLVRLRRSNEFQTLPGQIELDVASSGPALPLLFGKGTMIQGDEPSSAYSVRRDGLTVRATAIADSRPAMHVGVAQPQAIPPLPGVTSFALLDACMQNAAGAPVTLNVTVNPVTGVIARVNAGPPGCSTGAAVGRFVNNPTAISTVGQPLPAPTAVACASLANSSTGYGPVFSALPSGTIRIIGFARITLTRNACPVAPGAPFFPGPGAPFTPAPATPFTATISRVGSAIATSNATATLIGGLPLPANTPPADVTALLQRHAALNYGPVLVPVLAR